MTTCIKMPRILFILLPFDVQVLINLSIYLYSTYPAKGTSPSSERKMSDMDESQDVSTRV